MAMEERQTQIKERAGLDESRLNTDFIEMMKKWGPHLVMGLAIIAGGYAAYNWWTRESEKRADNAFFDLDTAMIAGNPAQLARVASDHGSSTAAPVEASIRAAEIYLEAARTGIPVAEKLDKDNKLPEGKAFLTDAEKNEQRTKAEEQFTAALAKADSSLGQTEYAIGALTGLASIAEDRAEFDKAKDLYTKAIARATDKKFDALAAILKKRIDSLDALKNAPKLLTAAELPGGAAPSITSTTGIKAMTADGKAIDLSPTAAPAPGPIQIPGGGSLIPIAPPAGAPSTPPAPPPSGAAPAPVSPAPTPTPAPAPKPAGTP
jgi:predicted negative regulator of RcsB-dependent stress response